MTINCQNSEDPIEAINANNIVTHNTLRGVSSTKVIYLELNFVQYNTTLFFTSLLFKNIQQPGLDLYKVGHSVIYLTSNILRRITATDNILEKSDNSTFRKLVGIASAKFLLSFKGLRFFYQIQQSANKAQKIVRQLSR